MSKEFSRRQFIKGALTMAGSGLGAGLINVGAEDYFKSQSLQMQARSLKETGYDADAYTLQRQSKRIARRATMTGVLGATMFVTSIGVTIKELK